MVLAILLGPSLPRIAAQESAQGGDLQKKNDVRTGTIPGAVESDSTQIDRQARSEMGAQSSRKSCGTKVVGGCQSLKGSWPSFALVHPAENSKWVYCGGSVIDPYWILTAAHCVTEYARSAKVAQPTSLKLTDIGAGSLIARAGVSNIENANTEENGRLIKISEIVRHKNYNVTMLPTGDTVFTNDVALLRLAEPATVPRQALARRAGIGWLTKPGTMSTVVGFGHTKEGGEPSVRLMQADVPIINEKTCKTGYPMMDYAVRLCAGFDTGGKDSCQGDSGGPLFVRDALKQPVQVGIVSYGHGCAKAKAWGVYSSVGAFEDWIKERVPNAVFSDQGVAPGGGGTVVMSALQNFVASQPGEHPSQLAQVTVDVGPGNAIRIGETIKVRVTSSASGRLVVFNRDESGRTTQIFPNNFTGPGAGGRTREDIQAGETIEIPGVDDKFVLRATPPAGVNEIIALIAPPNANTSDLTQRGKDMKTLADPEAILNAIRERSEEAEGSRGLSVEQAPAAAGRAVGQRKYEVRE